MELYKVVAIIGTVPNVAFSGLKWSMVVSSQEYKNLQKLGQYALSQLPAEARDYRSLRLRRAILNGRIAFSRHVEPLASERGNIGTMFKSPKSKSEDTHTLTSLQLLCPKTSIMIGHIRKPIRTPRSIIPGNGRYVLTRSGIMWLARGWENNMIYRWCKLPLPLPAMSQSICSKIACSAHTGLKVGSGFVTRNRSQNYRTKRPTLLFFFRRLTGLNSHLSQLLSIRIARKPKSNVFIGWRGMTY